MAINSSLYTPRDAQKLRVFNVWFMSAVFFFITSTILIGETTLAPGAVGWALTATTIVLLAISVRAYLIFLRGADELLRKVQLEAFAASSGAAIVFMLGYRLCERLGAPKLDVDDPIMVMAIVFGVVHLLATQRYAGGDGE